MVEIVAHIHHDSNYRTQSPWFKLSHTTTMIQIIAHSHHDSNYHTQPPWFKLYTMYYSIWSLVANQHTHIQSPWFKLSHTTTMIQIIYKYIGMFLIFLVVNQQSLSNHTVTMIQIITHIHHDSNYHTQPPWFKFVVQIIAHIHHDSNYRIQPLCMIQIIAHNARTTMIQIITRNHHDSNYIQL